MSGPLRQVEVVVIGGGPAGTAAAIVLAAAGREVLIIERTDYHAQRIGESLPPAVRPILEQLNIAPSLLADAQSSCPGTACCWGSAEPRLNDYVFDPDGDGLHVDRRAFDKALAGRAAKVGAEVLKNGRVDRCVRHGERWKVEVALGAERLSFSTGVLIDAAGRRKWHGRPGRRRVLDRQVAVVAELTILNERDVGSRTWIEATHSGWWYSAATPDGRLVAVYFTDADLLHLQPTRCHFAWTNALQNASWTRERLGHCGPLSKVKIAPASSSIASVLSEDTYVAVGDAATTLDPLSSHGILHALTSGLDASSALLDPNRGPAIRNYAKETARRFRDDLRTRQYFYRLEDRWADSTFWKRRAQPLAAV